MFYFSETKLATSTWFDLALVNPWIAQHWSRHLPASRINPGRFQWHRQWRNLSITLYGLFLRYLSSAVA